MKVYKFVRISFLLIAVVAMLLSVTGFVGTMHAKTKTETQSTVTEHDGQHDVDFLFGSWKVHCRRLLHPLTDSKE
jgi:hypothetical protein